MRNNIFLKLGILCTIICLHSCATIQQVNCPTFKQKTNKAAIAQAKLKQKERNKMMKYKAYLSEKYAANRIENERVGIANNNIIQQQSVAMQIVNPIKSIENVQLASTNVDMNLVAPNVYTLTAPPTINNKPSLNELSKKQQQRVAKIEARIKKTKEKIKRKRAKKSVKAPIGGSDAKMGKIGGILGILSLLFPILAIPGIILSFMGLHSSNRKLAIAGIVCGVLAFLWLIPLL